ncbi:histidine phosphatase family protein [uncultured Desulfobulbus sp.]|uniref:histidine phosphatase family protein n=1 Tax=uncultured Desulfobulbus sp. TaxID=239745 RepID=UPI0029C97AB1|nr:histidine phosphatase family protein [uncultured Desulfobulbus sp.]
MQTLIYLLRHGEIDKPVPRRFLGQTDLPLNNKGIRQAMILGEHLASIAFTHVFSSPLQRAVQTAALVSGKNAESITPLAALTEINLGAWEGLTVEEVRARFPGAYEQRGLDLEKYRPTGGESFGDLAARCFPALLTLAENHCGPLLIVAHAGVNRVVLSRLLHQPLQRLLEIPQDYCGVNILLHVGGHLQVNAVNLGAPCSDLLQLHDNQKNE